MNFQTSILSQTANVFRPSFSQTKKRFRRKISFISGQFDVDDFTHVSMKLQESRNKSGLFPTDFTYSVNQLHGRLPNIDSNFEVFRIHRKGIILVTRSNFILPFRQVR